MTSLPAVISPDFTKVIQKLYKEVDRQIPKELGKYVKDIITISQRDIATRGSWSTGSGSIHNGFSSDVQGHTATIYNSAPHAFLRQWGETIDGSGYIYKKDKKLFINKTGFSLDEIKAMDPEEFNDAFEYGIDYWFADFVRIVSNPYIAIPGLSNEARNKIAGYRDNASVSEKAYQLFIDSMMEIVVHFLKVVDYGHALQYR